jgi:hypothetical protein
MKTKQDFQECIASQEARILKIKVNPLFSDQEKNDMVAECRQEIERINRLQLAFAHRELKRSKRTQFVYLKGYETMITMMFFVFIFSIKSNAQGYIGGGINTLGMGMNAGVKIHNIDIGAGVDFNEFSKATVPVIAHANIGYDIGDNIIVSPSVGISYVQVTEIIKDDYWEKNYLKPYLSLSIEKDINTAVEGINARPYLFISYSYKLYAGFGLKIYFSNN